MPQRAFEFFQKSYKMQIDELNTNLKHITEDSIEKATRLILECKGKVVFTGMGKSGLIAQKLAATFSSTGTPSFFLHPGESLHGDLGALQKTDLLVLLAKSGESDEVISMLQVVSKIGVPVISILGRAESSAGRLSTVIIEARVTREADPLNLAPTASTTVALVVGDALASAITEIKEFKPEDFALFHPAGQLGKRLLLKVEDLLDTSKGGGIPIVPLTASMEDLLEVEAKPNLGGVMIVDDSGIMIGLITDGDIRRAILRHPNILECPIAEIMTRNPKSILIGTPAWEALQIMEKGSSQISVLPVVDSEKKPKGLLRLHDLVRAGL